MAHQAALVVAGIITASNGIASTATSLTTSLYGWASFGASVATIGGLGLSMFLSGRRRGRRRSAAPPKPPDGAPIEDWEEWAVRVDQFIKDTEGEA